MRIGFYGMPSAGKTYILSQIDFIKILAGSTMLRELCPDYDSMDNDGKNVVRRQLADSLLSVESFIMDGHFAFGDKIAFTESDGRLYDVFFYLYISP